ncbi:unnamed protein product [Coregonus sp. 'balchen']|nr:unnamed protein product [Coregonus sp. 'balchen']
MQGELLSPCRCKGSVRCTHQPCLIRWISERGSWSCELCYFKYHVLAISTKNPLQWQAISLTVIEKVQIAAIILGSLFLIASISWLIWSSLSPSAKWQRQDLLFQICYGIKGGGRGSRSNSHGLGSGGSGRRNRRFRTILDHHCGYTILHILSQLRPHNPRFGSTANREVVMRVTTV